MPFIYTLESDAGGNFNIVTDGGTLVQVVMVPVVSVGAQFTIQFALGTTTAASATSIPAGAIVLRAMLDVTAPYDAGTLIEVGRTGNLSLLMGTGDSFPATVDGYDAPQDTAWGGTALPVITTIVGAPAAGAALVTVEYAIPQP